MTTNVIIVGKGMAASVLALLLKQAGIDHVLLNRKAQIKPLDLAETLPPSALPLLQSIGLLDLFEKHSIRRTYGYHSLWGSDQLTNHNFYFHHPFKYGLKINKKSLLHELAKYSSEIQYEQLCSIKKHSKNVEVDYLQDGRKQTLKAKIIIDATGRSRALLKMLNITSQDHDSQLAFSVHLPKKKHPTLKHDVLVESFENGWGLCSGLGEDRMIVSIFTNQRSPIFKSVSNFENWEEILQTTKYLQYFLSDTAATKVRGKQANSSRAEKFADSHYLAIGDAALAFDPLSSHGISNAIYTSLKAFEVLLQKIDFKEYDKTLKAIFDTYLKSKNNLYMQERRWRDTPYWIN